MCSISVLEPLECRYHLASESVLLFEDFFPAAPDTRIEAVGDALYLFTAVDKQGRRLLGRGDGTSYGTYFVTDASTAKPIVTESLRDIRSLGTTGRYEYFRITENGVGPLYAFDKRYRVARRVTEQNITWSELSGGTLFFAVYLRGKGHAVFATSGRRETTVQLTPYSNEVPEQLTATTGGAFFATSHEAGGDGDKVYFSDGTPAGTSVLFDLTSQSGTPKWTTLTKIGDRHGLMQSHYVSVQAPPAMHVIDREGGLRRVRLPAFDGHVGGRTLDGERFYLAVNAVREENSYADIWTIDPVTARAKLVKSINTQGRGDVSSLSVIAGRLAMTHSGDLFATYTLNLATGRTEKLSGFSTLGSVSFNALRYYRTYGIYNQPFFVSDGTAAGTRMTAMRGDHLVATSLGVFYTMDRHVMAHYAGRGRVFGEVFIDKDKNGRRSTTEPNAGSDFLMFADSNRNGRYDSGEIATGVYGGKFSFVGLRTGVHHIGVADTTGKTILPVRTVRIRENQSTALDIALS